MAESLFTFTLTKIGMRQAGLGSSNNYSVTDIRELQRALKRIDPKLRTELLREAKKPAQELVNKIKPAIAAVTPLSGMIGGRLNWYSAVDAKGKAHIPEDVKAQFRTRSSGYSNITNLVRIKVGSPAVVMADMAGKAGRFDAGFKNTGYTREYPYKGGRRRHKVNGQGLAMVRNLGGKASRYVWPAAEQGIPGAKAQIEAVLRNAYDKINRRGL